MSGKCLNTAGSKVINLSDRISGVSGPNAHDSVKLITPLWGSNNSVPPVRSHARNRNAATPAHARPRGVGWSA